MSSSPAEAPAVPEWDDSSDYAKAIARTDKLMNQGLSFSGREPNCLFLNKGDGTFATASAVTGWDFPDDARAIGLVDWDSDGDLDAWISNRTAPMLRFLRNDTPPDKSSWLEIMCQGTRCRDAAGARVTVKLKGEPPLIRTVKFGEGFQSQNSRWLHFGLGKSAALESVSVAWPGGDAEQFTGCEAGGRFVVRQGSGRAEPQRINPFRPLRPANPIAAAPAFPATILTANQIVPPLPALSYENKPVAFTDSGGPTLIHLWDITCADCAPELKALAEAKDALTAAGLRVILISAANDAGTAGYLKDHAIPFPAAAATDETVRRLRHLHELLFGSDLPLPNPSGILLDGHGHAAALYRGRCPVERLLADVRSLSTRWPERAALALPFPGQWIERPAPANPLTIPGDLAEQGFLDESLAVFQRHEEECVARAGCAPVLMALAAAFEKKTRFAEAITVYRLAHRADPGFPGALNNLAWHLAACPETALRHPAEALPFIEKAVALTNRRDPDLLDTLATVHAANARWSEAEAALTEALAIARAAHHEPSIRSLEATLQRVRRRKP